MKSLIKDMVRPLADFLRSKEHREWNRLFDQYGETVRYRPVDVHFLSYNFEVTDSPSFIWQFKEIFVDEIYKFKTEKRNPIIYDCGANVGVSSVYFKRIYPDSRIKAFEPDPKLAKILASNLSANGFGDIEVINKAVWIHNDGVDFSPDRADGGSIYQTGGKIRVESLRLKEWIEKETEIDMLKIDIEGAENEILSDCKNSLANVKNLFVEYHSWRNRDQQLGELLELIKLNGFRYYLQTPYLRDAPFIMNDPRSTMDLQINIFACKTPQE